MGIIHILLNIIILGSATADAYNTSIEYRASNLYNSNTFQIPGNTENIVIDKRPKRLTEFYIVKNLGIVPVFASIHVRTTSFENYVYNYGYPVAPRQTKKLPVPQNRWQSDIVLKIKNERDEGAFVYAALNDKYEVTRERGGSSTYLSINTMSLLKSIATFGAGYIPVVGSAISALIDFFWQISGPDVWQQVSRQVEDMVDSKIMDLVSGIVANKVRQFRKRLWIFQLEYSLGPEDDEEKDNYVNYISDHYINIAQDMIGLEEEFVFDRHNPKNRKLNYVLLPYYCKIISLQYEVYEFGIAHQKEMNLSRTAMRSLRLYTFAILYAPGGGARDYLLSSYRENVENVMNECRDGEEIYNCMANARSYITMNGLDYWSLISQRSLDCSPLFSTYAGRPSHSMNAAGAKIYEPDPLMPGVWDGKCSVIVKVDMFFCDGQPCGLKTYYNDYEVHSMGEENRNIQRADFGKKLLKRLIVHGTGRVEGITLVLTDGSSIPLGNRNGPTQVFETKDYIISGIFVTNGVPFIKNALANLAVSYLPNNY